MPQYFVVKRLALGTSWATPTAIVVPFDCSRIVIEDEDTTNAIAFRSNATDPDTQKGIPAGQELNIQSFAQTPPFAAGTIVGYVVADAGSGPAVVSFTR